MQATPERLKAFSFDAVDAVSIREASRERAFRAKIRGAIVHPVVIVAITIGISAIVLTAVGPKLAQTFAKLAIEPPLTTKAIMAWGAFLTQNWLVIVSVIFLLVLLPKIILKTKKGKKKWDGLVLRLPFLSPIVKKINIIQTIRPLGSLLAVGIPPAQSLETISQTIKNHYYREALIRMAAKIKGGEKLSSALRDYPDLYSLTVSQAIEVGEATGKLPVILEKLGDLFEEEVLRAIKDLRGTSDPVLMLLVAGVIGFLVIAAIQPLIPFIF